MSVPIFGFVMLASSSNAHAAVAGSPFTEKIPDPALTEVHLIDVDRLLTDQMLSLASKQQLLVSIAQRTNVPKSDSISGQSQQIKPGEVPEGLSGSDWAGIREQIKAARYEASPRDDGSFASANLAHGWQIHFAVDGTTTLTPRNHDAFDYRIGLRLNAIGYAKLVPLDAPLQISNDQTTITYQWDQQLREIWTNSEQAVEQWFVLDQRPRGDSANQHLTLEMALDTDLAVSQQADGLHFSNAQGIDISYNKLKVWDRTGRELPAQMVLAKNALRLVVDDAQATYPLTIDPSFQQQAYLKAFNTGADDRFGYSVGISGDNVVVGAIREDSNTIGVDSTPNELALARSSCFMTGWSQSESLIN